MFSVLKKELKSYFTTPIGYIYLAIYVAVVSFVFYNYTFAQGTLHLEYIIWDSTIVLQFIIPVLTMRMFAEEKKQGTDMLLMTSPKSTIGIVLGKFFAATCVVIVSCLSTLVYYAILSRFGTVSIVEPLVATLGFILLSMAYISFGMFASSITENQVVAVIVPIAFFLVISFLSGSTGLISMFSLSEMYQKFPQGIISLKELIGYATFILLFTFMTIIVLQRRKSVK